LGQAQDKGINDCNEVLSFYYPQFTERCLLHCSCNVSGGMEKVLPEKTSFGAIVQTVTIEIASFGAIVQTVTIEIASFGG
jgi:hypothetical protein